MAQWTECQPVNQRVARLIPSLGNMPGLWARSPVGGTDADLGLQDLLLRFQCSNTHTPGLQTSCGGKGTAWPLSQEESASERLGHSLKEGAHLPLPWPSFHWFSWPLTSKKVLFYYAKVCFGWLSLQTQEGVSLNTSKENICNVKGEVVQTARFQTWKV